MVNKKKLLFKTNKQIAILVPEATQRPTCDPPQEIPCGPGQILKLDTKSDGCQQFVCQCKPIEDCDNIELTSETPLEVGYERFINSSGCCPVVELICKPELCPKPQNCEQFYNLKEVPGTCCSSFACEPPKEKCIFESKYIADEKGGEKIKSKYERQKELKNVCKYKSEFEGLIKSVSDKRNVAGWSMSSMYLHRIVFKCLSSFLHTN